MSKKSLDKHMELLINRKRLTFSFWIPETVCFSNEILKNRSMWRSMARACRIFDILPNSNDRKFQSPHCNIMEKTRPNTQEATFFFIFDPEHNVYGPKNGSTEKD